MKNIIKSWDDVPVIVPVPLAAVIANTNPRGIQRLCRNGVIHAQKRERLWIIGKEELQKYSGLHGSIFCSDNK